jgi:hypothetical protein
LGLGLASAAAGSVRPRGHSLVKPISMTFNSGNAERHRRAGWVLRFRHEVLLNTKEKAQRWAGLVEENGPRAQKDGTPKDREQDTRRSLVDSVIRITPGRYPSEKERSR